jgi:tetratricopeptide (TPR) repeat protein
LLLWHSSTGRRRLPELLADDPQNSRLREAEGRYLTAEGRLDEARRWLEELCAADPQSLRFSAALLELLFECDDWERFAVVVARLAPYVEDEPWLLTRMRGEFALHEKRWDEAVDHWQHLLEHDPANPWAHAGLARACAGQNRIPDRDREQHRSLILSRIRVGLVNITEEDYSAATELAEQCEEIGFNEAAAAFRLHSQRIQHARNVGPR